MFFVLFISVFYVVGFVMLGFALWALHRSMRAGDWPVASGSITDLNLKETRDEGTTYEVQVEYTYMVAGQAYHGSRLAFGYGGSSGREAHRQIFDKLKGAKSVDVRYDPANPSESTLSYGLHRSILFALIGATTWLAFIVGFTVLWWLFSQPDGTLLKN